MVMGGDGCCFSVKVVDDGSAYGDKGWYWWLEVVAEVMEKVCSGRGRWWLAVAMPVATVVVTGGGNY